jgi:NAD(P)-dependent dehydrogenase (short-subunit alcohol dehydrogenase family)
MKSLQGKVAAVTGAASGIGRATAVLLSRLGCEVAISDVDEAGLEETRARCAPFASRLSVRRVDVSKRDEVYAWADAVVAEHGRANIIVNNAGVAMGATIEDVSYEDFEWLMNINFWGVVYGTKAFLPYLKQAGEGAIVNVSSVFGLISMPTQAPYNAAKFAVKGFTEALREELEIEGANVGVTCVHPGGIKTNIARSARTTAHAGMVDAQSARGMEKTFITTPEKAAEDIVEGIRRNRRRVLIGPDARAIDVMQRVLPTGYQALVVAGGKWRRQRLVRRARG